MSEVSNTPKKPWFPRHCSRCNKLSRQVVLRPTHHITEYVMWKTWRCIDEIACERRVCMSGVLPPGFEGINVVSNTPGMDSLPQPGGLPPVLKERSK